MKFSRRTPLLSAALTISLFTITTSAADSALPNLSSAAASNSQAQSQPTNSGKGDNSAQNTDSGSGAIQTPAPKTGVSVQLSSVIITGGGSAAQTSGAIPSITGGSSADLGGALPSGLPTLSGAFVIIAPSVPPTANAPFMQSSKLPEGTVFIVVGGILGFLAMSVLLWRALVAWSLHRSVKRVATVQNVSDSKALFQKPPAPFYKYSDRDSTVSLSGGHRGGKKSGRPTTAPGGASAASLFFSPTAGAAGAGLSTAGNRGSNYLPSGYYAAGAAQPGNGQGMAHIGNGPAISLSNLAPQGHSYPRPRSIGPSPPDSPAYTGSGHAPMASSSTLNLTQAYGGEHRAPSAYLEDLFDGEGAPPVPRHGSGL